MLDLRRARVLLEIERRGSFSGAASALHYTQSAVSQAVAALERELDMTLVERSVRPVRLTDAGRVVPSMPPWPSSISGPRRRSWTRCEGSSVATSV